MDAKMSVVTTRLAENLGYTVSQLEEKSVLVLGGQDTDRTAKETLLMNHMDHKPAHGKVGRPRDGPFSVVEFSLILFSLRA
eukprot:scaffold228624_cov29-Prasinocladus_malaysianus.AAC.1